MVHWTAMECILPVSILRLFRSNCGTKVDGEEGALQVEQNYAILQCYANFIQFVHTLRGEKSH